jgi:hypothetical protein
MKKRKVEVRTVSPRRTRSQTSAGIKVNDHKNNSRLSIPKKPRHMKRTNQSEVVFEPRLRRFQEACTMFTGLSDEALSKLPQSESGKTTVYLLEDLVVKVSGEEDTAERFEVANQVRTCLNRLNITTLTVPFNFKCGQYLIEERLHIQSAKKLHNLCTKYSPPRPNCFRYD